MIEIDASIGEGGGQIVRTSLALAMCTGTPITLRNIRAHRDNPGLRAQHLAAVHGAAAICSARVEGDSTASRALSFRPGAVRAGRYEIDVGTAGSTMLVFQTILPPLSFCSDTSEIVLRGGTHNPRAPTFEFVRDAYVPLLDQLGFRTHVTLERHGFFPKGGGVVRAVIEPFRNASALELMERGAIRACTARALLSQLPEHIGNRELSVLRECLHLSPDSCSADQVEALGTGNALYVRIDCDNITTLFDAFGTRGVPAEKVAGDLARQVELYLDADVAADRHLADQVLLPLALGSGGRFSTLRPSAHAETNVAVIRKFLRLDYEAREITPARWSISLNAIR